MYLLRKGSFEPLLEQSALQTLARCLNGSSWNPLVSKDSHGKGRIRCGWKVRSLVSSIPPRIFVFMKKK